MRLAHVLSLLALAAFAFAHWSLPVGADQAFYASGAQALDQGAVLYGSGPLDFTDHHGPGTFLAYQVAGSSLALRRIEIVLWLLAALGAVVGFGPALRSRALSVALPWVVSGGYVFGCATWIGGQPASLAAPLFTLGVAALAWRLARPELPAPRDRITCLVAGVAAGLATACKPELTLAVLPLAALLGIQVAVRRGASVGGFLAGWIAALALVDVALGPGMWLRFVSEFAAFRASNIDMFLFPSPSRLAMSVAFTAKTLGVLCLFAALAAALLRRDATVQLVLVWAVGAAVAFIVDMYGWWAFDTWPLLPAGGVLSLFGVRWVAERVGWTGHMEAALIGAVVVVSLLPLAPRWLKHAKVAVGTPNEETEVAAQHAADVDRLRQVPDIPADAGAYVIGAPTPLLHLPERPRVARRHGWAGEIYGPTVWAEIRASFEVAEPFLLGSDAPHDETVARHDPALAVWIDARCQTLFEGHLNRWRLCRPGAPAP